MKTTTARPHPNHFLDSFEAMFSVNCPSHRAWEGVGEPMLKIGGRGSNARKCLSARTEIFNPKHDLGVDKLYFIIIYKIKRLKYKNIVYFQLFLNSVMKLSVKYMFLYIGHYNNFTYIGPI